MKNYDETNENFICNYYLDDNNIIIVLGDNTNYIIPYTIDNERKILNAMRRQINNFENYKNNLFTKKKKNFAYILLDIILFIITLLVFKNSSLVTSIISKICLLLLAGTAGFRMVDNFKIKNTIIDLYKNKIFVDNEDKINAIVKNKSLVLESISEKVYEKINEKNKLDINDAHEISSDEMLLIKRIIDLEEEFDFDYPQETKKLTLKK